MPQLLDQIVCVPLGSNNQSPTVYMKCVARMKFIILSMLLDSTFQSEDIKVGRLWILCTPFSPGVLSY